MPIIKLYANLRKLAGTKELSIIGTTVGMVLNGLVEQSPALAGIIVEDGHVQQHIVITINEHNISDLDVSVTNQNVIAIFPPIAGG